jgi:hypothetical protein
MRQAVPVPDQRSSDRFGLALPITMEGEECASHDLSASGLLVQSPTALDVGAPVDLTLEYERQGQALKLACHGQVVRIEQLADGYNIGVRLDRPLYPEDAGTAGRA